MVDDQTNERDDSFYEWASIGHNSGEFLVRHVALRSTWFSYLRDEIVEEIILHSRR